MKKCFDVLLNKLFKRDLESLFGEGSKVNVNFVKYSTNSKTFVIDCTLHPTDIELTTEVYPDGLIILVEDSWKYTGYDQKITVTVSLGE